MDRTLAIWLASMITCAAYNQTGNVITAFGVTLVTIGTYTILNGGKHA